MSYPERIPEAKPLERFVFDLKLGEDHLRELDAQVERLEERIDTLVKRCRIANMELLKHIMGITDDPVELRTLGNALVRVADLLPQLKDLSKRRDAIKLAMSDPHWLAATFGDFTRAFDGDLDKLNKDT